MHIQVSNLAKLQNRYKLNFVKYNLQIHFKNEIDHLGTLNRLQPYFI